MQALHRAIMASRRRSPEEELAALEAELSISCFSWLRADTRTESAAKVLAFQDRVAAGVGAKAIDPAHAFSQPTSTSRANAGSTSVYANNRDVVPFVTARYDSTLAPSDWQPWHSGYGLLAIVTSPTAINATGIMTETQLTGNGQLFVQSSTNNYATSVYRPSTGQSASTDTAAAVVNVLRSVITHVSPTNLMILRSGGSVVNQALTGTSASTATTMHIGARPALVAPMNALFAEAIFATPVNPAPLIARLQRYFFLRYGLVP